MKPIRTVGVGVLALACLAGILLLLTAQAAPGKLPGLVSPDPFPHGCIDCHKTQAGGTDTRLNVTLKTVAKHPDIARVVRNVPTDCAICHKAGSGPKGVDIVVHKSHYEARGEGVFVKTYGGDCLSCHALSLTSFEMTVKSAPKNW
jgi:hypothetical protein